MIIASPQQELIYEVVDLWKVEEEKAYLPPFFPLLHQSMLNANS
jgi:hypothetical protein